MLLMELTTRKPARSLLGSLLGRNLPDGDRAPLLPQHIHLGSALIHAGRREGVSIVLEALTGEDRSLRSLALNDVQGMCGEKLGRNGQPGAIPLSIEEIGSALALALKDMFHAETREAMEGFSQRDQRAYLPVLAPLRWHKDPKVFRPVIAHFVEIDCDDDTLDAIANHLLEPGIRTAKDFETQTRTTHDLCEYLAMWTDASKAELHRKRAAQIAGSAIIEALDSQNAAERLAFAPKGWLSAEDLFNAVCHYPSDTTAGLLERVATTGGLEPRTRADALMRHKAITGVTLSVRQSVIQDFFTMDTSTTSFFSKFIENLVRHKLVTLDELARGAANPNWTDKVTSAIEKWTSNGTQDEGAVAVSGLLFALARLCRVNPNEGSHNTEIGYVLDCLATLPRSPEDNASIRQSLETAHFGAQRQSSEPWLAQELGKRLLEFGGGGELDLNTMNPWDAMREHWRREDIHWQNAAALLAGAGAMSTGSLTGLANAVSDTNDADMRHQFEAILLTGGRACSEWLNSTAYVHHHDKLFSAFVRLAHQPIALDAVVQHGDLQFDAVALNQQPNEAIELGMPVYTTEGTLMQVVVSFQGQKFKFYASPNGTYMDAWAVFHAFNLFMAQMDRPERVFWLGSEQEGEDSGLFVCALPKEFLAVCEKLRLPVRLPRNN